MSNYPVKQHNKQRGMALASGMLALFGLLSFILVGVLAGTQGGGGLLTLTGNGEQSAAHQMQTTAAFNIADSGVEYTLQWLHSLPSPPNVSQAFPLPAWNGKPNDPGVVYPLTNPDGTGGTFTVWIFPGALNNAPINNATGQGAVKYYLIQSTGTSGGVSQTVQAYVQQTSFGNYAIFLNSTPPNAYWGSGLNVFDGPVHSNNSDNGSPPTPNGTANNIVWSDGTGSSPVAPIFTYRGSDAFTVSGPSVNWYRNTYGNSSPPASEAEWDMIATAGSSGVHTGVPMIPMPPTDLTQQYAAMGQTPPGPGSTTPPSGVPAATAAPGVLIPSSGGQTSGGMYIHGPVQQMTLSVDPNNSTTQIIQIQQTDGNGNPYTTTLTLTPSASPPTTQVHVAYMQQNGNSGNYSPATTDNTYTGVTNGVVYCDSDIGSQSSPKTGGVTGVVADKSTLPIATDTSHNVNIDGRLTYNTPRQKDSNGHPLPESDPSNAAFLASAGMLGIVSQNVEVTDKDTSGNAITSIEVDAAVMASGTYDACDYGSRPPGAMLNMGSYIVKTRGIFNTSTNGNNVVNGIPCSRYYDNRLASRPPPFFPTTSSQYQVLSWQRVAVPL